MSSKMILGLKGKRSRETAKSILPISLKPKALRHHHLFGCRIFLIFLFSLMLQGAVLKAFPTEPANLRILTINVWSGLDYKGVIRMGEYETAERRKLRFQALLSQIQEINPDVIFVQEANPVAKYSARLADSLGFDKVHQVCLAGIKFGPLGIPTNFKEGMAILARPTLHLRNKDVWKLSGSFGVYGDAITIHFDESIFLLVGKINVQDTPVYLVNVHLASSPPEDTQLASKFESLVEENKLSKEEYQEGIKTWESRVQRRTKEMEKLLKLVSKLPADSPVIVAGDFNDIPNSRPIQLIQSSGFFDVYLLGRSNRLFSWDPGDNENISFSSRKTDSKGSPLHGYFLLDAIGSEIQKRIDYIFLNRHFQPECVKNCRIVLDESRNGVKPSDHYGMFAEINLDQALKSSPKEFATVTPLSKSKLDFLPILMYDTNVGFGYGGKFFLLNPLRRNESFDLVLFNSTKGERWYHFVFSWPDFERRQGKIYPLALDLLIDYDKWIKNSFFGVGNESRFEDREYYTREPLELRLTLNRGFSPHLVGQVGAIYRTIRNFNFEENSRLEQLEPALNSGRVNVSSFFLNLRSDTRDSYINPSSGTVVQGEAEFAPKTGLSNTSYTSLTLWLQHYYTLFYPKTVMALRLGLRDLIGDSLPVQVLLPIGGSNTLRGFPQDRFLGKTAAVFNAEIRFPIFWRLGAVAGFDAGKVWSSPNKIDLTRWAANSVLGLRFYMDTFVVRADIGFGKETTGFYFNFGHIF
jgi:endonuclease/exonuclease/phosphatase family metal-dependent hydrolase